jgi:thymidine phosphorylase
MTFPQEIIRAKREGAELDGPAIQSFVQGLTDGSWSEGQIAALAMAVFFRGMSMRERAGLTTAMARSGAVLDWRGLGLDRPILDKHSTGGVGDKVSLILAPIVAACGGAVPMISGRGLGHTGGTLDKLDSIPGYNTAPSIELFRKTVAEAGAAIIGQTADLAPADRRLYAIRDVTATVESIPLITASILSKKLAAGLEALVMDVKFGSGAFAVQYDDAKALAESIVTVAREAGLPATALLTDMNEVLGRTAGHAAEVREAIDILANRAAEPRLLEVTLALSSELLQLGGLAGPSDARARVEHALASGLAAERFARMVRLLGGPGDILERPERHLAQAPLQLPALPRRDGFVTKIDVRRVGVALMELGGGRRNASEKIDHAVGFTDFAGIGEPVGRDRPLAIVHARDAKRAAAAQAALADAVEIAAEPPLPAALVAARIAA